MSDEIRRQLSMRRGPGNDDWRARAESALKHSVYNEERLTVWVAHLSSSDDAEKAKSVAAELAHRVSAMDAEIASLRRDVAASRLAAEFMDVAQVALPNATYGRILDRAKTQARNKPA